MPSKSLYLAATALATGAAAATVPTVSIPLNYKFGPSNKISTEIVQPGTGEPIDVVVDTGSENFWVFAPGAVNNWGCQGVACLGPCNASVTDFLNYSNHPDAKGPFPFDGFYSYGGNTKVIRANSTVNDTLTFTSEAGVSSVLPDTQVAVAQILIQRFGTTAPECVAPPTDMAIMGISAVVHKGIWNTAGPSIRQNLLDKGSIQASTQSMWFDEAPALTNGTFTGHSLFGGIDHSKYTGPLVKIPYTDNGRDISVGYYSKLPTVSVGGKTIPQSEWQTTTVCQFDSGTQLDDIPADRDLLYAAAGLTQDPNGNTAFPGDCESIPDDLTIDFAFPAVEGQAQDVATVKVPVRAYVRQGNNLPGFCKLNMDFDGCMMAAPFSTAAFFAADDGAQELALAQGGVSKRGSTPDDASITLHI